MEVVTNIWRLGKIPETDLKPAIVGGFSFTTGYHAQFSQKAFRHLPGFYGTQPRGGLACRSTDSISNQYRKTGGQIRVSVDGTSYPTGRCPIGGSLVGAEAPSREFAKFTHL
jgi:hypothetical protein